MRSVVTPLVTVIITCYEQGPFIDESVGSMLRQSLDPTELELIAIDDASTDGSWSRLLRYATVSNLTLIKHERNLGNIATYNEGLARARGRYVVILNADDLAVAEEALALQATLLDENPQAGFACSDFRVIDAPGRVIEVKRFRAPMLTEAPEGCRQLFLANFVMHSGTMIRRSCLEEFGGYDPEFPYAADLDLWLRISSRFHVLRIDRPLYSRRIHPGNMSNRGNDRDRLDELIRLIDKAMSYPPHDVSGRWRRVLAAARLTRARVRVRLEDYRAALADLRTAWSLDPWTIANSRSYKVLGHVLFGVVLGQRKEGLLRLVRPLYYRPKESRRG